MKRVLKSIIMDFHKKPLPQLVERDLGVPLDLEKIITIIGPRRAGKTWYFFQLMKALEKSGVERQQCLYINFEDERLDIETNHDDIIDAYLELYPKQKIEEIYIFFDEIQEVPQWEKYVRRLYDTVSRKIFITGSNSKMLSKEIATSLRGRSFSFEIMPLSFCEFLKFKNVDFEDRFSVQNKAIINSAFDEYLIWGGYPELVNMKQRFRVDVLQEYFNVMLYRDLTDRYKIKDSVVLKYLIKRLIGSFTKEFSVNKLYNDLKSRGFKISKNSIYQLVDHIFSVYMVTTVEKYDSSVVRREMSNRKVYLYDNGIASATHYSFSEDRGKLLENLVYNQLRPLAEEIFFLKNGYECDFAVFYKTENPLLVQVTHILNQDNFSREIKGLEKAKKRIANARCLLLVNDLSVSSEIIPKGIDVKVITDWLLE